MFYVASLNLYNTTIYSDAIARAANVTNSEVSNRKKSMRKLRKLRKKIYTFLPRCEHKLTFLFRSGISNVKLSMAKIASILAEKLSSILSEMLGGKYGNKKNKKMTAMRISEGMKVSNLQSN